MIIADKMNESRNLNEALKPSKIGWYGNSNPKLPDGSPELSGENKAISVSVIAEEGQYGVVALMGDEGEDLIQTVKRDKVSATQLAEKLLKEVTDPMYDAKKVAKKYKMDYFKQ